MDVLRTIADCRRFRDHRPRLSFVPTMGALHPGHLSLVDHARRLADSVVVSIFVNPTQFGPNEDFARYPRPVEKDLELCLGAGVDAVFLPAVYEIYPPGVPDAVVDVPSLTARLEGAHRPGHFVGVCSVVAKLINIVEPDSACFGEKDFQQLAVIRAMARGLDMRCQIVGCPTLRDPDGLALSSRNQYLSADERRRGLSISRALRAAAEALQSGTRSAGELCRIMREILLDSSAAPAVSVDLQYASVVDAHTLDEIETVDREARALVALKVGSTRLIDNIALIPPARKD